MSWWPGWDSIESTDFWNTFYFWAGIACLFLLGAFEVISHYYGERHSALIAAAERAAAEQRDDSDQQIEKRHAAEVAQLQEQLAKLQERRTLTPDQKAEMIVALSPFREQKVRITSNQGDLEGDGFARDFYDVVTKSDWSYVGDSPDNFERIFVARLSASR